jgi:hypothetical protein
MFALAIRSSTTGAIAQTEAENDCDLADATIPNLAQTNLSNQETLLQLSIDKLIFLTLFEAATTPEELEPLARSDVTIEEAERIDTQVMAAGIQAMRRMCPAAFQKTKNEMGLSAPAPMALPRGFLREDE